MDWELGLSPDLIGVGPVPFSGYPYQCPKEKLTDGIVLCFEQGFAIEKVTGILTCSQEKVD